MVLIVRLRPEQFGCHGPPAVGRHVCPGGSRPAWSRRYGCRAGAP